MSRRALPPRATRGSKPVVRSAEEQQIDNELYARMFGNELDDDQDFVLRQARENQRKERTMRNLAKYSYARGYTYCFDLGTFGRVQGHPSYASDQQNVFKSTYKQEQRMYKGNSLGELINRVYFGLPYTENQPRRGEGKTKNACHFFLFENEDRKYQLDRAIATFKALERRIERGKVNSIKGYALVKKDFELDEVLRSQAKPEGKVEALRKKIQALQERKSSNVIGWYHDDELFLQHSRNQLLHDQAERLKKELTLSKVSSVYYEVQAKHRELIEQGGTVISGFLREAFTFYSTDHLAISDGVLSRLIEKHRGRVLSLVQGQPGLIFPQRLFHFGSPQLRTALDSIIASKVQQQSQASYYLAKFAWRRLFKAELPVNSPEKQRPEEMVALGRRLVEEAKHFYKQKGVPEEAASPNIDCLLNWEQIQVEGARGGILRQGQGVQISGKQLMILCAYNWLLKAYSLLLPFVQAHPQLSLLISSDQFQKFTHGFAQATNSPLAATFRNSLELLAQLVPRTEPIMGEYGALYYQWEAESGVGVVWRSKPGEEVWETEKEDEQEEDQDLNEQEEGQGEPAKKLKEDEA